MPICNTPTYIINHLPYEAPKGWLITEVIGKKYKDSYYVKAICPNCQRSKKHQLNHLIYRRPKQCITCTNEQQAKKRKGRSQSQISVRIDSDLLTKFKEQAKEDNIPPTRLIKEFIKSYVDS